MRSQARWQHRTVARSDVACEVGTCHRCLQCCGARSWIVYFFSWNKPIGGRGARSIAISAVLALTTMTMGHSWSSGVRMETYHWFLLGIMVALTPSLIVLGLLLAR